MFYVIPVTNTNPQVGPINNGKQAISVYDRQLGNNRTIISTPDEVDCFIHDRQEVLKDANKRATIDALGVTALGAGIGAGISCLTEGISAKNLQKLVDKINPEYEELFNQKAKEFKTYNRIPGKEYKPGLLYNELLGNKQYKKFSVELHRLFDDSANKFKNVNLKPIMKEASIIGACIGTCIGLILGAGVAANKIERADKKITNEFIEKNKFISAQDAE